MSSTATETIPQARAAEDRLVDVFNALRQDLLGALVSLLGNQEDAQDALQIAFLHCWQGRSSLGDVRDLRSWIWRIGVNAGKDLLRNAWRRRARPLTQHSHAFEEHRTCPATFAAGREDLHRLRQALAELRTEEKEVFLLRQNEALTWEEIAALRQRPVGTVKTQMRAALHKLRRTLADAESDRSRPHAGGAVMRQLVECRHDAPQN